MFLTRALVHCISVFSRARDFLPIRLVFLGTSTVYTLYLVIRVNQIVPIDIFIIYLLYIYYIIFFYKNQLCYFGAPPATRTRDTVIKSHVLCQLS